MAPRSLIREARDKTWDSEQAEEASGKIRDSCAVVLSLIWQYTCDLTQDSWRPCLEDNRRDRESDLGRGDFRSRRDLGGGDLHTVIWAGEIEATNLAARGSGWWRAGRPLRTYPAKNQGWLARKIEEEEDESVGDVFTILIAIFRGREWFDESVGDALTLINRALVSSEPNNLSLVVLAAHRVLDVGPTCHKPTKAAFPSEIKKKAKGSVRLRFIILVHSQPTQGAELYFWKEHSSQSIPEHMNHFMNR
jgi:hypothetical protein